MIVLLGKGQTLYTVMVLPGSSWCLPAVFGKPASVTGHSSTAPLMSMNYFHLCTNWHPISSDVTSGKDFPLLWNREAFFSVGSVLQMAFRVDLNPERKGKRLIGDVGNYRVKRITLILSQFLLNLHLLTSDFGLVSPTGIFTKMSIFMNMHSLYVKHKTHFLCDFSL